VIGNARDAEMIRNYVVNSRIVREERSNYECGYFIGPVRKRPSRPEGWKRIGGGCFRSAWLSPDGVIYKVEHAYGSYGQSNSEEYENVVRILTGNKSHPYVSIPRVTYYALDGRGVIAMEYVKGENPGYCHGCGSGYRHCTTKVRGKCINQIYVEIEKEFGLFDMHSGNVMFIPEQESFVVIDIGA
jgi:hypothetical protein